MALSGRNGMLLFAGGVDIAFGVVFILMGEGATLLHNHRAVGVAMWAGIALIMVGLGLVVTVLTSSKKRMRDGLNINLGSLILNLTGVILAAVIIGFFTWGAWSVLNLGISPSPAVTAAQLVSIYTAVLLMAIVVLLISLMAMFMDCCSYALFSRGPDEYYGQPPRPRYYDGPYGPPPAHIYKQ